MRPAYDQVPYPVAAPERGRSMIILGTSKDGPVNVPVPIKSPEQAFEYFGGEGSLYKSYLKAFHVDNSLTIYLLRVTGSHAEAFVRGFSDQRELALMKVRSMFAGEIYNEVQILTTHDEEGNAFLVVTMPEESRFDTMSYPLKDYDTIEALCRAINEDMRSGNSPIYAITAYPEESTESLRNTLLAELSGGWDGMAITKNELFLALDYTYLLLEGFYADVIVVADAYFDDVTPLAFYGEGEYGLSTFNEKRDYLSMIDSEKGDKVATFHGQLIDFCKKQVRVGFMTHGIIGMNLIEDYEQLQEDNRSYIMTLVNETSFNNRYDLAEQAGGNWIDSGYYISVVAGEFIYEYGSDEPYSDNWCVTYGAMLCALKNADTTTNVGIPNDYELSYEFTPEEMNVMAYLGVVCPRTSVRKGLVVAAGVTAGLPGTDMQSIANVRQVQFAMSTLNGAVEDFTGEDFNALMRNKSIDKVVESALTELKSQGILIDYNYNIEYDRYRAVVSIETNLLAKQMVDYISTRATLSFSG